MADTAIRAGMLGTRLIVTSLDNKSGLDVEGSGFRGNDASTLLI